MINVRFFFEPCWISYSICIYTKNLFIIIAYVYLYYYSLQIDLILMNVNDMLDFIIPYMNMKLESKIHENVYDMRR